jgi:proteic killer suppression protein
MRVISPISAGQDVQNIPGLRFHPLRGRDKGRYAVDASGNWRITFGWDNEDAVDVDLEDYH